jgi:hypothetical protein
MNARLSAAVLLVAGALFGAAVAANEDSPPYDMRLGVNGGIYPPRRLRPEIFRAINRKLDELGTVWLRHPGQGSGWAEVEPEKGTWDWTKLDGVLLDNGHPWLFEVWGTVGTPYPHSPSFKRVRLHDLARQGGKKAVMNHIKAHSVDLGDPVQRADAERYVKTFVGRYKDRIRYWEIGNEGINSPGRFEIVRWTYQWVKEVHPDARVVVTALAGDDERTYKRGLQTFDRLMAKGMGRYFDIGNIHYYGRIDGDFEARLEQRYDEYRAVLAKWGTNKPIWVTETSTSSNARSPLSGPSSEQTQARHVVVRAVVFFGKGAEKVFWHDYRHTREGNKFYQCSLVNPEAGKPKPAYHTLRLLVEKLGFFRSVERVEAGTARVYRFLASDGKPVIVAWDRQARTIDVSRHLEGPAVRITHIVEQEGPVPSGKTASGQKVPVSPSPVFVEEI